MKDITDIFYNHIIQEAASGRVNCIFMYNIIFNTNIKEENKYIRTKNDIDSLIIPTLTISNKQEFDKLLTEYVIKAKNFYDLSIFEKEINENDNSEIIKNSICIEKVVMTLLWSNATTDDFENPIQFLKKRIAFIDDKSLLKFQDGCNLGYSEVLKSNIHIKVNKDKINNETPYFLEIKLINPIDENDIAYLPDVKVGICDDKAYIYAIQNRNKNKEKTPFEKYINRKLFKIGENYSKSGDDLKDITASFVVSATLTLSLINSLGIKDIIIPSILTSRWNGAIISDKMRSKDEENIERMRIQSNLTEKFLRTFRRINYHCPGIQITSLPYDVDSNMHIHMGNINGFNNTLLNEIFNLYKKSNNNLKK